jgi:PAS domain S-box-containing protein
MPGHPNIRRRSHLHCVIPAPFSSVESLTRNPLDWNKMPVPPMPPFDPTGAPGVNALLWDDKRVERLGPALVAAANTGGIGLAIIVIKRPDARIVYMTDVGAEIIGHPKEAIVGQIASTFLTPEQRVVLDPAASPVPGPPRTGLPERRTFETSVVSADGRGVPIEVTIAPVDLDGEIVVVAFFRDITQRNRSTEALRLSEERFRKLIELAPDAVWINDGRRLMYVNPATVRMLGYDTVAAVMALNPLDIVHPDDHAPMIERSRQMMTSGQSMPPLEYRIRKRDGSIGVTEVQSMPIEWEGQKAILGFARDVTARKEMETQMVRSDRLAALGTLLAGIAHEMNNPLAYVLLGVDQALLRLDELASRPANAGGIREILEEVRLGATRVAAVVNQLRATSRPDTPERGVVDVGQTLQAALRVAGNEIRHRARLVTELDSIPVIDGNAQRLEQVFLNLLVNATQALPEGRAENEISVRLREAPGALIVVEIRDNGAGISSDVLPRIFDPFFTTKAVGVGMGLGLSICHGIVSAHGGTIDVESGPTRGTLFRVTLPVHRTRTPADMPIERSGPVHIGTGRRRRVLVIDDEPALASMIQRMLQDDFDVDVVTTGRAGLERMILGVDYDTILCDLMMPEMTGMDLYAAIAEKRPGLQRRFVFMTGGAFTARAADFLASVRNRKLDKPFDLETLRAIVERR